MKNNWLKLLMTTFMILTVVGYVAYRYYAVEVHSLNWQPLPPIDNALGESQTLSPQLKPVTEQAEQIAQKAREAMGSPGLSIAVGLQGQTVWTAAYGYADVLQQTPMTTASQFRIGSTSKALTSLALGRLIEQGKLQLDDTIGRYLPDLPEHLQGITIRQLASHQSGIRNYGECWCFPKSEYFNDDEVDSVGEALQAFIHDPLIFKPGQQFAYSSYNYTLLSAVMENAAGKPFLQLMQTQVYTPLQLGQTAAEQASTTSDHLVSFYNTGYGYYQPAFAVNNSNKWAGGGMLSTPSDLVKMANQLLDDDYLQAATKTRLFEPQKLNDGTLNPQRYALGWRHSIGKEGRGEYLHHGGTAVGSTSLLVIFPEQQLTLSVLINSSIVQFDKLWDVAFAVADVFGRSK